MNLCSQTKQKKSNQLTQWWTYSWWWQGLHAARGVPGHDGTERDVDGAADAQEGPEAEEVSRLGRRQGAGAEGLHEADASSCQRFFFLFLSSSFASS